MAKKKKTNTGAGLPTAPSIIVNDFSTVAPDRNRKDIGTLKSALIRAESVQLPNRVQLYDLYHDILSLDAHLSGIVEKRTLSVINKPIRFVAADDSRVDALDELINSERFSDLLSLIMGSVFWGVSGVQFIRGPQFDFVEIPRKHIRPELQRICLSQYSFTGYDYSTMPDVWVIGKSHDLGKLLSCSMYALYKRSGIGDFAQYVEIFGQPVRVIYYDAYDTKTRDDLRRILNESGSSVAMMIPKQAQFEMLDGKTSNGTGELQDRLITTCNREMSVAILGNSETTVSSNSSGYAQSQTHAAQQQEITLADLRMTCAYLNSPIFLNVLASYGFPVAGGHFEFKRDVDLDALTKRLAIDREVATRVPVDDDYWYSTYNIPRPENYDALKAELVARRDAALASMQTNNDDKDKDKDKDSKKKDDKKAKDLFDFFDVAP